MSKPKTKVCKYCGVEKDASEFRKYYQGTSTGKPYSYCKVCEKIEFRRKHILRKQGVGNNTPADDLDLDRINKLYDARCAAGLEVPPSYLQPVLTDVVDLVEQELKRMKGPE